MIGKTPQSSYRSVALGATVQSAAYGKAIGLLYGRAKLDLSLIWMANIRQVSNNKKSKKGNTPDYAANVDFLLCHNPVMGMLQCWVNQNQYLLLDFTKYTTTFGLEGPASVTIPDSRFYAVIAVTVTVPYGFNTPYGSGGSITFDDYGAPGAITVSGDYELPLWNLAYNGPDPTFPSALRNLPYCFSWTFADGNQIYLPFGPFGPYGTTATLNVYYAQLPTIQEVLTNKIQANGANGSKNGGPFSPAAALNLEFEHTLGDGDEYTGTDSVSHFPLSDQQILYPHYCGLGSEQYAMGSTQTFPDTRPELLGSFPIYSEGDADFADMAEDIFKGYTQAGFGNDNPRSPIQHGLNCYSLPGTVQALNSGQVSAAFIPTPNTWTYPQPNVAGDFLIVVAYVGNGSAPLTISDTASNDWTALISGALANSFQVWYCTAKAWNHLNRGTTITLGVSWFGEPNAQVSLFEVAGVDEMELFGSPASVESSGPTASVTTSGAQGTPEYMLAISYNASTVPTLPPDILWRTLLGKGNAFLVQSRISYFPQEFTYKSPIAATNTILFAFKCSQPPSYPQPLGNIFGQDILDQPSMQIVRNQCRAAGLFGSLYIDAQGTGKDQLDALYEAMNAWFVWSGFSGKSIARSEVSAAGNGAVYIAPTSGGPVIDLLESDFASDKDAPVEVSRKAQVSVPDILQVQHPNRTSQYNDITISEPESGTIAMYGPRKGAPKMMRMFQDPAVSRMYLNIQLRMRNLLRNSYSFPLKANIGKLLEPGDLITFPLSATLPTLPDQQAIPYIKVPARITSISEDEKFNIKVEAEPYIYGCYAPVELPVTDQQGFVPHTGGDPGSVDAVVIFEPVPRLAGGSSQPQLWIAVGGGGPQGSPIALPDYGGCYVYISTDGGNSYNPAQGLASGGASLIGGSDAAGASVPNAIFSNAITGTLINDWPAAPSPDTTNNLSVLLDAPGLELPPVSVADEDNYVYPCWVQGAGNGAPLIVQHRNAVRNSGSSCGSLFGNPTTMGDVITAIVAVENDPPFTVGVADSDGNVYTKILETKGSNDFGPDFRVFVFTAPVTTPSSSCTVTATVTGGGTPTLNLIIFEASSTLAIPDGPAGANSNTVQFPTEPVATGPIATTQAGDLIVAFAFSKSGAQAITPNNFIELESINSFECNLTAWYFNSGSPGAYQAFIQSLTGGGPGNDSNVGIIAFPGTSVTPPIPYELMTYSDAELISVNGFGQPAYELVAVPAGSPANDNHLDRGVFGAPAPNTGVDHPLNSKFAFVGPPYPGIIKLALDPSWIGKTLYFKFAAFNSSMGQVQPLSDCDIFQYTPTGGPTGTLAGGSTGGNYTQSPGDALSNPTSTTIEMVTVTENFNGQAATYNARTFDIPNPTEPTTYYVTITDPAYQGDLPGQTNLAAICQTSNALVGTPGNIYIGSIVAMPGGGGTIVTPGGSGSASGGGFVLTTDGE